MTTYCVYFQFGSWVCWICWVFLSVLAIIKVYRYHKREAFMISMNRERQRLLQKVGHTDPLVMWSWYVMWTTEEIFYRKLGTPTFVQWFWQLWIMDLFLDLGIIYVNLDIRFLLMLFSLLAQSLFQGHKFKFASSQVLKGKSSFLYPEISKIQNYPN